MGEAEFTKEPLFAYMPNVLNECWHVVKGDSESVANFYGDNARENAILFAVSQNMYGILQSIVNEAKDYQRRTGNIVTWAHEAEFLLAKARGEL